MRNREYTYKDLIQAYMDHKFYETDTVYLNHEELKNFYDGLYAELSKQFGIKLMDFMSPRREGSSPFASFYLRHFVHAYIAKFMRGPGLLEAGGLPQLIEKYNWEIFPLERQLQEAYWKVFDDLFHEIFGEVDKIVTSEDLRKAGFDDTSPRREWD